MVDIDDDMILNISNIINEPKKDNQKLELKNNSKNNYQKTSNENKKYKSANLESICDNDFIKNINVSIDNSSNKKKEKSDYIFKNELSKENLNPKKQKKIKINKKYKNSIEQASKIYKCDKCAKTYNIKNSYQKHLITHNKKKYICSKCDARFSVESKLKRHLLIHNDNKEFKCSLCDSAFHLNYNLKVHMRVHNNEKPYICGYPGCFAKFAQKNNLNTHNKIHNNNLVKENDEQKMLINYYNNIIKFNNKSRNLISKLEELNKIAFEGY